MGKQWEVFCVFLRKNVIHRGSTICFLDRITRLLTFKVCRFWEMVNRLRESLSFCGLQYMIAHFVELNDRFFNIYVPV